MADFAQTVTNQMNIFTTVPQLWNAFNWGTNWAENGNTWKDVVRAPLTTSVDIEDSQGVAFVKSPLSNTIDLSEDLESIMRAWGIWDYLFASPTSDGDSAVYDQFTKVSDGTDSFSKVSDGTTTWEDV